MRRVKVSSERPRIAQGSPGARRRTLSQNFLRDPRSVQQFLAALPSADGASAVEVGAGEGALTVPLALHFGSLTTWELDPTMADRLIGRIEGRAGIRVVVGDFLASAPPGEPFHLAGNVPFSITSSVVTWALAAPTMRTATLITQWEYARKRSGDYGRWTRTTVLTWPAIEWRLHGRVARGSFRPVPAVDAGVLGLRRRDEPLVPTHRRAAWEQLVTVGFTGVGGSLFASLRALYPAPRLRPAFAAAGLGHDVVVGFVHPNQWVALFAALDRDDMRRTTMRTPMRTRC